MLPGYGTNCGIIVNGAMLMIKYKQVSSGHVAQEIFHVKSKGSAMLKYYDWLFKRFYGFFVYTVVNILCEQNHGMATRADFRNWSILWVALDGKRSR